MKQGWEIKKLGDISKFYRGLTYSKGDEVPSSTNIVLRSNNVDLETNALVYDDMKCLREDLLVDEDKKVKANSILICMSNGSKQHIGKVAYIQDDIDYAFGGFMGLIVPTKDIEGKYLYYSCVSHHFKHFLAGIGNGIGITNLRFSDLSSYCFPVPPIAEQEKIVAELDCLSGIIEKKKQQLKELDNLAQSIFYEMFGDPVENDKGWDVSYLKDVCLKITDGTHNSPKSYSTGAYMYITAKNIKKDGFDMSNITYVLEDVHSSIYSRCNPVFGDILYIKDGATTGIAMLNSMTEEFSLLSSVALLKCDKKKVSNVFIRDVLNFPSMYKAIRESMGGAAITRLTLKKIEIIKTPMPPIALQQEYSSQIEVIEKQKELIKQSIQETETLFNSRMDYYFN